MDRLVKRPSDARCAAPASLTGPSVCTCKMHGQGAGAQAGRLLSEGQSAAEGGVAGQGSAWAGATASLSFKQLGTFTSSRRAPAFPQRVPHQLPGSPQTPTRQQDRSSSLISVSPARAAQPWSVTKCASGMLSCSTAWARGAHGGKQSRAERMRQLRACADRADCLALSGSCVQKNLPPHRCAGCPPACPPTFVRQPSSASRCMMLLVTAAPFSSRACSSLKASRLVRPTKGCRGRACLTAAGRGQERGGARGGESGS